MGPPPPRSLLLWILRLGPASVEVHPKGLAQRLEVRVGLGLGGGGWVEDKRELGQYS